MASILFVLIPVLVIFFSAAIARSLLKGASGAAQGTASGTVPGGKAPKKAHHVPYVMPLWRDAFLTVVMWAAAGIFVVVLTWAGWTANNQEPDRWYLFLRWVSCPAIYLWFVANTVGRRTKLSPPVEDLGKWLLFAAAIPIVLYQGWGYEGPGHIAGWLHDHLPWVTWLLPEKYRWPFREGWLGP